MPNFGVIYAALFEEYRQKVNGFHFSMRDLKTREQASMGLDDYSCSFGSEVDAERVIGMAQEKIFRQLIYAAQKQFAPPGGLLSIDEFATKRVCGMYNTEKRLDFVKVWAYLEETYGGDRGVEEAWRQAAKALGKEFGLSRDTAVEVRGGKTILHIRIYIDSFDKKNGKNKISYTCCERIGTTFHQLQAFASWAELKDLCDSLDIAGRRLSNHHEEIVSRANYGGNGIQVVTFLNRYEFRFMPEVAEQFQIFIGTFGFEEAA